MASVEAKSRWFSFSNHRTVDEDHGSFIPSSSKSGSEESPGPGDGNDLLLGNTKWWFNQQHKGNSGSFWRETFPTSMQNDEIVRIRELEKKPTLPEAFDRYKHIVSDEPNKILSELESQWIGIKKNEPWWRTADLDDFVSQKSLEHFDNCDLPLPQTNKTKRLGQEPEKEKSSFRHECTTQSDETENLESELSKAQLLEALCHSQRRAREAETAAQQACNEKEHVIALFLRQASQIFAYKQWLHILHLEALCLQLRHNKFQPFYTRFPDIAPWFPTKVNLPKRVHKATTNRKLESVGSFLWGLALVGAGVLLGWTLGWLFPEF